MMSFIFWALKTVPKSNLDREGEIMEAFLALLGVCWHADETFSCSPKIKVSKKNDSRD